MDTNEIIKIATLFGSSFGLIFLLGFQSQLVRFKEKLPSFITSLLVGTLQLFIYKTTPSASIIESISYVFGGSFGLVYSIICHTWWLKITKKMEH